jgi:hypothetical protein
MSILCLLSLIYRPLYFTASFCLLTKALFSLFGIASASYRSALLSCFCAQSQSSSDGGCAAAAGQAVLRRVQKDMHCFEEQV